MSKPATTEEAFYTVWMNGVLQERDRIIALLESIKPGCECNDCDKPAEEARTYLDHIIALIKGENE